VHHTCNVDPGTPKNNSVLNLRDLECFMAIVEQRNFGRAAPFLGMTQPALSRRIAALEDELGTTLLSRAHRQVELTTAGELLSSEARDLLTRARLVKHVMRQAARGTSGNLRLGTRSVSRYLLIPDAIRRLREMNAQYSVTVIDPLPTQHVEHLRNGLFDITVLSGPVKLDGGLRRARLRGDPMVVALPERHPLAERQVVDSRDLAKEAFIEVARYEALGYKDLMRGACARAGFVPRVVQEVDTVDMLAVCVAAGMGVALMHDVRRELSVPGVVYRPIHPAEPPIELSAVWRADDANPVIEPFVECLAAAAGQGRQP